MTDIIGWAIAGLAVFALFWLLFFEVTDKRERITRPTRNDSPWQGWIIGNIIQKSDPGDYDD